MMEGDNVIIVKLASKNDIQLDHIFTWLTTGSVNNKDLENIVNKEVSNFKEIFPFLLLDFIKGQTSRILKWNNVAPELSSPGPSPKREPLLHDFSASPRNLKNVTSPVEIRNVRRVTPQKPIDLQSETAFPSLQLSSSQAIKETPKKRRINPTQLLSQGTPNKSPLQFGKSNPPSPAAGNPFNQAREQMNSQKSLDLERALLKERKQSATTTPVATTTIPDILSANVSRISWACIEPELSCVTHKILLDRLCAILAFCLSNQLIPTLYSEIKLLIQLLVIRVSPARYQLPSQRSLLDNVHNCVYFAAKTLEQLDNIWSHVDRYLMQQLMSNPRLMLFAPDSIGKLSGLASSLIEVGSRPRPTHHPTVANVPFQTETDNRLNFASDSSFQYFRKQRDQFCEVWQIWKANHANPAWNMAAALQRMIQTLVNLKQDVVNYFHLARLFRSQLLNVAQLVEIVQDDGPLSQLQSSDPDKLRRLRERLTNPRVRSSTPGVVHFEGDQEFFRDFIQLAANPAFNEHLKNSLVTGIEEGCRAEDWDDQGTDRFAQTVIALRVQAKFLAFLTFHPHTSTDHLPENVFHQLSRLRSAQKPPIDLFSYADEAVRFGRLVLTVPWLVTYLSLADPVSLSLPNCHPVLCQVVYIYRRASTFASASNAFFVRILLSWLFEQTNFPRSLLTKTDVELNQELKTRSGRLSHADLSRLDELIVIDSTLLLQCCPFLWTWKHLLADFASSDTAASDGAGRSLTSRKITPVSAEDSAKSNFTGVKSLQASLEENFFHNQPSSVKRTVDFVSERVASNIVRDVRHQIIPRVCTTQTVATTADDSFYQRLCQSVGLEAAERVASASESLNATLAVLLPNDLLPAVKQVCCKVAARLTNEKVFEWINLHVTASFFRNELIREAEKVDKASAKRSTQDSCWSLILLKPSTQVHDAVGTWSPSFLIDHLKSRVREIIQDEVKMDSGDMMQLISECDATLHRRMDLMPVIFKCVHQLTFDLLFVLCVFQPENIVSDVIRCWADFWKRTFAIETVPCGKSGEESSSSSSSLWLVFAPRQLLLLAQSTSARHSWNLISILVIQLLTSGLLRYKDVQEQCLSVVRHDWPQELLGRFATCIRDIVDWQKGSSGGPRDRLDNEGNDNEEEEDGLLDWLSWFCSQDDLH